MAYYLLLITIIRNFSFSAVGGSTVKVGSSVKGLVVDLSDGVVNLSLKSELVGSVSKDGKKKVIIVDALVSAIYVSTRLRIVSSIIFWSLGTSSCLWVA